MARKADAPRSILLVHPGTPEQRAVWIIQTDQFEERAAWVIEHVRTTMGNRPPADAPLAWFHEGPLFKGGTVEAVA